MMTKKQIQKSGDNSVNVQAESLNLHTGLSYADVKEIALDVFRENFLKMKKEAKEVAESRAEEITEKILQKIQEQNPEALHYARDPDFQFSFFTVQKEYARSGDKELGDLLVDILVDRTKVERRSILQIALNESLTVVPKLTMQQLSALSIIFILRYTRYLKMESLENLKFYINHRLAPFIPNLPKSAANYQHLEYAGCGTIRTSQVALSQIFRDNYPGIFTRGFSNKQYLKEMGSIPGMESILTECFHDNRLLQFNASDSEQLKEKISEYTDTDEFQFIKANEFWLKNLMNDEEIKDYLTKVDVRMAILFDVWSNSPMMHMTLTSVGIAIGHAYCRVITGDSEDLSIWIS